MSGLKGALGPSIPDEAARLAPFQAGRVARQRDTVLRTIHSRPHLRVVTKEPERGGRRRGSAAVKFSGRAPRRNRHQSRRHQTRGKLASMSLALAGERPLTTQLSRFHMPMRAATLRQKRPSAAHGGDSRPSSRAPSTQRRALIPPGFRFFALALEAVRHWNKIRTFPPHSAPKTMPEIALDLHPACPDLLPETAIQEF